MIRLQQVSKTFPGNDIPAVDGVSLEIGDGELFTLLGPSGCGKTTTLRILAGLEKPDAGTLFFEERLIADASRGYSVPPHQRNVGMVFQSYAIWPHFTVEENVVYPLEVRGVPRNQRKDRVARALELVGLQGLEKRPAPMLSGGQQQRVALARALVYEPSVLLLDEPFSNLDAKLREQMRVELKLLQRALRVPVVFVTHDQVEALSLSDRLAVMNLGRIQQIGAPHELYEQPANSFVRDFVGKTVLLKGEVRSLDGDGGATLALDGSEGPVIRCQNQLPESWVSIGGRAFVALRPDDLEILPAQVGTSGPLPALEGVIETELFTGERTEYQVRVPGQGVLLVHASRRQRLGEGSPVWVRLQAENATVWPM